jgi:nucleotide-binding universal stress UspA family protein
MNGKILIVFDSLSIRKEAMEYAIELAGRTDSSLMGLFLINIPDSGSPKEDRGYEEKKQLVIREVSQRARRAGLDAEAMILNGNPSSELMKFLADHRLPRVIVWGGRFSPEGTRRQRDRWFSRIKDRLGCPVVVPSRKA